MLTIGFLLATLYGVPIPEEMVCLEPPPMAAFDFGRKCHSQEGVSCCVYAWQFQQVDEDRGWQCRRYVCQPACRMPWVMERFECVRESGEEKPAW